MPKQKSHRGKLTERIVRIPLLLANRPYSQGELAEEFDVDNLTIRRNMAEITTYYPISDRKEGREVVYFFIDGGHYKPPNLTPAELAALLLAQHSIAAIGSGHFGTPLADYSRTLIEKVRAALPQSLRQYLDTLSNIFGAASVPAKDYMPHAETIDRLTKAAMATRRLRMRYHSLHDDKIKDRDYDPYAVYFDPDGATLKTIGLDHRDHRIKPFSIDRILSLKETGETFERPADFDLQKHLLEFCFNGIHGEPMIVRLRAYGIAARVFAERRFHPSQDPIEAFARNESGEETITIQMRVARGRGLLRFILSWGADIEVLDPPELRREVEQTLRRALDRQQ